MSDAKRRALRTLLQFVLTLPLTAISVWIAQKFFDPTATETSVLVLTLQGFLQSLVTMLQNYLEDAGTIPAFAKAEASDGANPTGPTGPGIEEGVLLEAEPLRLPPLMFREVPEGQVLIAVDPDDLTDDDVVVGHTGGSL